MAKRPSEEPNATEPGSPEPAEETSAPRRRGGCLRRLLLALFVLVLLLVPVGIWEVNTSTLQSRLITRAAEGIGYELGAGPSPRIRFPEAGPFDVRLGYTDVPRVANRLRERGFRIDSQAVVSEPFATWVDRGFFPIYTEKLQGGLIVRDRDGVALHRSPSPARIYPVFDSIPELLWRSLVFIENREFLDPRYPHRNPAVEWDRLGRAVVDMGMRALGSDRNVPGGSTLATQLEKFRHSPEGRTGSATEKLLQMGSASLRVYRDGRATLDDQRRILTEYLNSVPLAAQRGHGEVVGTADGLWAWYGIPFDEANRLLRGEGLEASDVEARARVYRQALSLLIAHRRPTFYLAQEAGREELARSVDLHLGLLAEAGVIDSDLAGRAQAMSITPLERAPERPPVPFVERKAASQLRTHLMQALGLPSLYELDRYDLSARATLDMGWQEGIAGLLQALHDPDWVRTSTFAADRLLASGDPTRVIYTFTLLESTELGNVVRVQTDNYDGPLSLTEAGRLELGSTAKLRTLITYLEVIADLHGRLAGLPGDSLAAIPVAVQDRLSRWTIDWLRANPEGDLRAILDAAMDRTYSANPGERFATGGGVQSFSNFDATYNGRVMTVREAFRQSVNLPSIRTMRDIVNYFMFRTPGSTARILEDVSDPARQAYLERFADQEGRQFLRQFHSKYEGRPGSEMMELLVSERGLGPERTAWAFRTVAPEASAEAFAGFLLGHTPNSTISTAAAEALYERADPAAWTLNDLGYLARIHPLELWLVRYLLEHPGATLQEVVDAGTEVRQEVYEWLFRTRRRNAQDQRIRTILELEAFQEIHRGWSRLGYPFGNIVPSFGTAIGSSGDRPLALSELVGIVVNGGVRRPVVWIEEVRLAEDTPFETRMSREPVRGEQVLDPVVAAVVREALIDVVENGTARRARGSVTGPDGEPLVMGGKTGTGDNRYRVFGAGGQLVESRAVNRTSTFAFFVGDRWFGVVTAYVPGPESAGYRFTSALPSELFRVAGATLSPLGEPETEVDASVPGAPAVESAARPPILYEVRDPLGTDLYRLEPDGSSRLLTPGEGRDWSPRVSPDGERILFTSTRGGDYDVWSMTIEGEGAVNLTDHPDYDVLGAWSPDGARIAFMSTRGYELGGDDGPFPGHLYLAEAGGSEPEVVTRTPLTSSLGPSDWSPDGGRILMARELSGSMDVVELDLLSGTERRLTRDDASEYGASWSHDGARIAYHADDGSSSRIVVANADGTDPRVLSAEGVLDYSPRWSPDDRWLLVTRRGEGDPEHHDVIRIEVESGRVEVLLGTRADERAGDWVPVAGGG